LVNGEGSSGSSSGSSRMVPPPTPQTNHWRGYSSISLTDWSAAGVTRSGRRIHQTWTPRFLSVWIPQGQGVWQQPPDYPWPEGSNHSSNTSDPKGGMREGHWELCRQDPNVPAVPGSSFGAPVKQRVFVVQTWNFGDVCYTGLTYCSWSFVSI